jgi:galactose mutarotase-like enzyme
MDKIGKILFIENDYLKLRILPKLGAKVSSIIYKPQNFEILFQPTENRYSLPRYEDSFEKYDTSGIDELFPNVEEGKYPFEEHLGKKLPDHGEIWSIPWKCRIIDKSIVCTVMSIKFQYIFERKIHLKKNFITFEYSVKNIGNKKFRGFWTFHGLLAIDEKSELLLNIDKIINVHDSKFLGNIGNICAYPIHKGYRVNKFLPKSSKNTEKFFLLSKIDKAGIILNNGRLKVIYDLKEIPFLGIWKNEGGFKKEYNCALEPSNGFYDSMEIVKKTGKYMEFLPDKKIEWKFSIGVTEV